MFNENVVNYRESNANVSEFMSKVYGWMSVAMVISSLVAWFTAGSPAVIGFLTANPILFYGLMIVQLLLVISLSGFVRKMSLGAAIVAFIAYSVITGLTLSTILLIYTASSIVKAFMVSAGVFAAMGIYGYTTKRDLTGFGSFLFMSLIGLLIASLVNIFLHSYMIEWITTYAGVIIFAGLTAWDTQKLKYFGSMGMQGDDFGKMAILGALTLYLDFINLFLYFLRVFGDRR